MATLFPDRTVAAGLLIGWYPYYPPTGQCLPCTLARELLGGLLKTGASEMDQPVKVFAVQTW